MALLHLTLPSGVSHDASVLHSLYCPEKPLDCRGLARTRATYLLPGTRSLWLRWQWVVLGSKSEADFCCGGKGGRSGRKEIGELGNEEEGWRKSRERMRGGDCQAAPPCSPTHVMVHAHAAVQCSLLPHQRGFSTPVSSMAREG